MMTSAAARFSFDEKNRGSIEAGQARRLRRARRSFPDGARRAAPLDSGGSDGHRRADRVRAPRQQGAAMMNRRLFLSKTAAATVGLAALPGAEPRAERERDDQRRDHRPSRRQQGPSDVDRPRPRAGSLRTSRRHPQRPHHACRGCRRTAFQRLAVLREGEDGAAIRRRKPTSGACSTIATSMP